MHIYIYIHTCISLYIAQSKTENLTLWTIFLVVPTVKLQFSDDN